MDGVPLPVQAQLTEQQPHLVHRIPPGAGREKLNKTLWGGMTIKRTFLIIPGVHRNRHILYFMEKVKSSARTVRSKLRQRESKKDVITSAGI